MLKINKILSKKIKSPLSLRGLFPFCHSRESGNPSSMSFRGEKQRSNLKGFSLIELMIAAVILALAVLGIFLAFSNAWMGMANARDRTVATNYAREAMEDVKNMDFELVTFGNLGTAESVGAKFTRVIIVNTENENLKKIDTTVFWTNRQDQIVSVDTSMYINRTLFNPGAATHLNLYADPYYTVLPGSGIANIIAVIKDSNGNTKIDWNGGDIHFTILGSGYSDFPKLPVGSIGSELGDLESGVDEISITPNEGRADITFHASGYEISEDLPAQGDVVIEASVDLPNGGGTISDTITIVVTLDVVRIELSAVPDSLDADGTSISTVTAALVNSGGATVKAASNEITFSISGEGIFVDSGGTPLGSTTVPMTPSEGTATIYVQSIDDTPGVATVIASSKDLIIDTVNITTTGDASSIFVSVDPDLIYIGDPEAMVTVKIQDINGIPVKYTGTINLAISGGTGIFEIETGCVPDLTNPNPLCFDYVTSKYTTFSPTSVGIIIITASGGGLADGSATIDVQAPLIADTITIKADPKNILAGGFNNSEITATIKQGLTVISNYSNDVIFEIFSDTSSSNDAKLFINGAEYGIDADPPLTISGAGDDGEVVVYLKSASEVGICTIKVSTVNSLGATIDNTVEVGFYSGEDHIELKAFPSKMLVEGDTCRITATVVDEGGIPVANYNEDITFTILVGWPKNVKFAATGTSSLTTTLTDGDIDIYLIPQKEAGTVTLKASSFTGMTNITGYLNIPVDINFLDLTDPPSITYDNGLKKVSFDIEVQGTEIGLDDMQVSWSDNIPSELLNKIDIGETVVVYSNDDGVASGIAIDIAAANATLPIGISTINLYFNELAVMFEKTFNIIFNPNSGNYSVEFEVPST